MPILKSMGRLGVLTSLIAGMSAFAEESVIEEVVVTGSYIKGTAEDAALPVDVISNQELFDRGSPNMLDVIRAMPYVTGIVGESNQFGANQGTIGTGNVNLRGLGGMRTLVLMNGRRTTYTPAEGPAGVDTNLLPIAAVGRIEVLKDGAAATYGSDAIAGVVNFITRKDLDGLELNLEHRMIDKAARNGDWTASANWGWTGDNSNILLSFAQQYRGELKSTQRDWAFPPYLKNPTGWSAAGMPGTYIPRAAPTGASPFGAQTAPATVDANCTDLGGYRDPTTCRFSFIPFDNIVEKTEQEQFYGEINVDLAENVEFHVEGLMAKTKLPDYRTSPGYPPTSGPFGPGGGQFTVNSNPTCATPFCNNPGAALALQQAGFSPTVINATRQIQLTGWRPQGWGGVPELTGGNGGQLNVNSFDMKRVGASLKGSFDAGWLEGTGWDIGVTYSESEHHRTGVDTMITRLQAALNGLGGPNCNGIAFGQPGSTCLFYNPFGNAIARNPALNLVNPGHNPAFANGAEIKNWMIERWDVIQDQSLLVVDAVFDGEIGGFELPGGNIGWAFGAQYRKIEYETRVTNPLTDANVTPCPIPGDNSCVLKTGPFIFLGQFIPQRLNDDVHALFVELALPIWEGVDVQAAVRYEEYGSQTGNTVDPKISARWQATDWLAVRGSWGTTFRGPTPVNKSLRATGLQPLAATGGQYRSIDNFGDPTLVPEKAETYSVGVIFQYEGFEAIVDYWNYDFEDQITGVPFQAISQAVGNGTGTGAQFANCSHPLRQFVTFDNNNTCTQGVTTALQMQRIKVNVINGSPIEIAGFDVALKYDFGDVAGGNLSVGVDATLFEKYDIDTLVYGGVTIFTGYSAEGLGNLDRQPGTVSKMRAVGNVNYAFGDFNARYEVRYVEGVTDERATPSVRDTNNNLVPITFGKKIDDFFSHNFYVNWNSPWDLSVSFSIVNILDEDPPEVRHQLSYDPYIGDPLGRTFELGFRYTLGGDK
jgi:iron complex outermembrane receptor protein